MSGEYKAPGIYIAEKNAFPDSVVEVATAVPAFIGYTEKAVHGGKSLLNKPCRISSMGEFLDYFGGAPAPCFTLTTTPPDSEAGEDAVVDNIRYYVHQETRRFLYYSMLLFFQNGGGPCYIISVGSYADGIEASKLIAGVDTLLREQEPTLVVAPDAVLLDKNECVEVQQAMLDHCGEKMKNRLAILDIHGGDKPRNHPAGDRIADFRNAIGTATLSHGAAYYPWLQATVTNATDFSFHDFSDRTLLRTLLEAEQASIRQAADNGPAPADELAALIAGITQENEGGVQKSLRHKTLLSISKLYGQLLAAAARKVNTLPPSAAIAGIYTMVDNACGVWKAPANIGINSITRPIVNITNEEQEDLNVPLDGKSVNAIRAFINEGVLVWGARTLDGNSQDWRYISVRRTMIMLEESIKRAAAAYVFEPNVANTWVTIKSMMRNYLTSVWKRGGLAGATPDDAFSVSVGLGETMTPEDILEGLMRVTVLVAPTRPAEFIELTFQQQMQKS